jgi:PAS domain S-box-containing protein
MIPTDPSFYKELLDHMSDGVYFVDADRKILYWNEGAFLMSGYSAHELVGRSCQDDILCHVDYERKRLCQDGCPLSASIEDGGSHEANVFLRHKQGRRVPVTVRVQPMRGADGAIVGAI